MNAIDLLIDDHEKVTELFDEFEAHPDLNIAERIFMELEVHTKIEEEIFYPVARVVDNDLINQSLKEHGQVKNLIGVLRGMTLKDKDYNTQMEELMANVEDHVDEEETDLFPQVEEKLADQLDQLGDQMQKRKAELQRGGATRTTSA